MVELYYNRKDGDFVTALNRHFQGQLALAGECGPSEGQYGFACLLPDVTTGEWVLPLAS